MEISNETVVIYVGAFSNESRRSLVAQKTCEAMISAGIDVLQIDTDSNEVFGEPTKNVLEISNTGDQLRVLSNDDKLKFVAIFQDCPQYHPVLEFYGRVRRIAFISTIPSAYPRSRFDQDMELDEIWVTETRTQDILTQAGIPAFLVKKIPLHCAGAPKAGSGSLEDKNRSLLFDDSDKIGQVICDRLEELRAHDFYLNNNPTISICYSRVTCINPSQTGQNAPKNFLNLAQPKDFTLLTPYVAGGNMDEWVRERKKVWAQHGPFPPPASEMEKLEALKDKYLGKRIFIIGNGPSLNKIDFNKLKNEYTFGVNKIYLMSERINWYPTFYTCIDWRVVPDVYEEINSLLNSTRFFPNLLKKLTQKKKSNYWSFARRGGARFYDKFEPDITKGIAGRGTVLVPVIQLAFYLGFREIYLIGVDADFVVKKNVIQEGKDIFGTGVKLQLTSTADDDPNHFDPRYFGTGTKWHDPNVDEIFRGFEGCRKGVEGNGGKIYNATVGGKLDVFERVEFEDLFKSKMLANDNSKKWVKEKEKLNRVLSESIPAKLSKLIEDGQYQAAYELADVRWQFYQENKGISGYYDFIKSLCIEKLNKAESVSDDRIAIVWIGRFFSNTGYGTATRGHIEALKENLPETVDLLVVDSGSMKDVYCSTDNFNLSSDGTSVQITHDKDIPLYCIFFETSEKFGKVAREGRSRYIGLTLHESDVIPKSVMDQLSIPDELWVPSHWNKEVLVKKGLHENFVQLVPLTISDDTVNQLRTIDTSVFDAGILEVQNKFTFFTVVSNFERKNVSLLVEAYLLAFAGEDDVALVIKLPTKVSAEEMSVKVLPRLNDISEKSPSIIFLKERLTDQDMLRLHRMSDCYINVESGKGWDLDSFYALSAGKPVIATIAGGCTEYLSQDLCEEVKFTPVRQFFNETNFNNVEFYGGQQFWEPSVASIQGSLCNVFENYDSHKKVAEGFSHEKFNYKSIAKRILERVKETSQPKHFASMEKAKIVYHI